MNDVTTGRNNHADCALNWEEVAKAKIKEDLASGRILPLPPEIPPENHYQDPPSSQVHTKQVQESFHLYYSDPDNFFLVKPYTDVETMVNMVMCPSWLLGLYIIHLM